MSDLELFTLGVSVGTALYYYLKYQALLEDNRDIGIVIRTLMETNKALYDKLPQDQKDLFSVIKVIDES